MKYYAHIENGEILQKSNCKSIKEGVVNIEISKDVYTNFDAYSYDGEKLVLNLDYEKEQLETAKKEFMAEVTQIANDFINNVALYRDIECTSENISKLTAYLIAMQQGLYEVVSWVTKSDEVIELTVNDLTDILQGIGTIQSNIWNVQYMSVKTAVENVKSIDELRDIKVEFTV